jgi:single-stranded DNA-specific DHH superfamily exonuclease
VIHVADDVRQLVARVRAFEMRRTVDVVVAVDHPMHVEHDDGINAEFTATAADFVVTVDCGLTASAALCKGLR